jgi:hypothetical protein
LSGIALMMLAESLVAEKIAIVAQTFHKSIE